MNSGQTVEIQADSVEEAIALAREQMGLSGDTELRVEVLEDAKEGFFLGFGSRKAKIKVSVHGEEFEEDYPAEEEEYEETEEPWRMSQDDKQMARDMVEDFLGRVCSTLGLEIRKEIMVRNDKVAINIDGEDVGILIGKDGQTLMAIQYLLSIILSRNLAHKINVDLDISGYKIRKRGRLERVARDAARRAMRTGQQIVLDPMDSQDRKIIHMTLRNSRDVETFSEGNGDARQVIISPRRRSGGRSQERGYSNRGNVDHGTAERGDRGRGEGASPEEVRADRGNADRDIADGGDDVRGNIADASFGETGWVDNDDGSDEDDFDS